MKVKPAVLAAVLLVFGGLLYGQYQAGLQWRSYQGPSILAKDHSGKLYVQLGSKLLRYDTDGRYLDQRDFQQLGVMTLSGGIAFFPNGDLLLVPQEYQPSLLQNLLIHYRITKILEADKHTQTGRLSRCDWETFICTPLPFFDRKFVRTFWLDVDDNDNIFLADTSQHRLYWLDKEGRQLDMLENPDTIQFPNQLQRMGNQLVFANCNDNSLSLVTLLDHRFDRNLTRFKLAGSGMSGVERWPTGVVVLDNTYYILAQGDNLMHGAVVKMHRDGKIEGVFQKDRDSDYVALVAFNGELLVANYPALGIKRYDNVGRDLGYFQSPELEAIAQPLRQQLHSFQRLEKFFQYVFWMVLVTGFAIALWLEKRHKKASPVSQEVRHVAGKNTAPLPEDSRIRWIQQHFFWKNIFKWFIWFDLAFLLWVLPGIFSAEEESVAHAIAFVALHGVIILQYWHMRSSMQIDIGACTPWVFLKKSPEAVDCLREQELKCYRALGSAFLVGQHYDVQIKTAWLLPVFEGQQTNAYLDRLFENAMPMSFAERLQWVLDNKAGAVCIEVLLLLLHFVVMITL